MKSSVPKVAAKSLNIFEEFQALVKLQVFSFTKNDLLHLVFFQGVLKADLVILSDLRSNFAGVVKPLEVVKCFPKGLHLLNSIRFLDPPLLFSYIRK